jgi:hypothetical protein
MGDMTYLLRAIDGKIDSTQKSYIKYVRKP